MTVDSGYKSSEQEGGSRPTAQGNPAAQPVYYNSARHGSHVEESPELLRWRADLLMDEMMMGGVDVSAADGKRTFTGVDAPIVQRPPTPSTPANGNTSGNTSHSSTRTNSGRSPRDDYASHLYENGQHEARRQDESPYSNGNDGRDGGNAYDAPTHTDNGHSNGSRNGNGFANGGASEYGNGHYGGHSGNERAPTAYERNGRADEVASLQPGAHGSTAPRLDNQIRSDRTEATRALSEPVRPAPTRPSPPTSVVGNGYQDGTAGYGFDDEPRDHGRSAPRQFQDGSQDEFRGQPSGQFLNEQPPRPEAEPRDRASAPDQSLLRTPQDNVSVSSGGDQAARTDRLYSVEQQYEQFRREQVSNIQPVESSSAAPRVYPTPAPQDSVAPPKQSAPPRVTPQPADQQTQWATGPDKWEWQDFSATPGEPEEPPFLEEYVAPERTLVQDSAVRQDSSQFTNAMSFISSSKKRSTLLPRMSTLDVDTLHREISDLHGEIAVLLPIGNDTSERARHLLDKAYSILQSDPMRSAEVEYYMQQVRTIVQRLYQARQWSDLYRQRLHVYLWAWLGLSAVVVMARFLFQTQMEDMLGLTQGSLLLRHWATFTGTVFAGALGGAIGALYTMRAHARGEHSFFDRKYGLRGLILPIMGLAGGALGYLIFGLIFAMVGIDPSQNITAAIVPTVAAFAFGFSQESIYGTRD